MNEQKRILFVAMPNSPHAARWIDSVAEAGWDLHFFPVNKQKPAAELRAVTLHQPVMPDLKGSGITTTEAFQQRTLFQRLKAFLALAGNNPAAAASVALRKITNLVGRISSTDKSAEAATTVALAKVYPSIEDLGGKDPIESGQIQMGESDATAPVLYGPNVLAKVIDEVKPDLIHSMEFQHCGYLTLAAKEKLGDDFPPWLATNWGSDIFYYQNFPDHLDQIKRLLDAADYYSCECHRDVRLAQKYGFQGRTLPVLPNSGGFNLEQISSLKSKVPTSKRKMIMLKCYDHFAGRGMMVLDVLERFKKELQGYEIVLFSVGLRPFKRAQEMKSQGDLDIKIIDWAPHKEILSHFGQARLYMAISVSDGVSTSALEAMAMGAFPIQTMTACCDEWFDDGVGGFHTDPDDFEMICDRFYKALTDDELVDKAAVVNAETVATRLDQNIITPQIKSFYDEIFETSSLVQ